MTIENTELIGKIEQPLNIRIPDGIAQKILTIGDVYEIVKKQVNQETANYCLTQVFFNRLRQAIHENYSVPKALIRQETLLEDIIPLQGRRQQWHKLNTYPGFRFPKLVLPGRWETILMRTGITSIVGCLYVAIAFYFLSNVSPWIFIAPVAGAAFTLALSLFLNPLRVEFPEKNMLNLSYHMQLLNRGKLKQQPLTKHDLEVLSAFMDTRGLEIK